MRLEDLQRSLSERELVLGLDDALRAVDLVAAAGQAPFWEGWLRYPDGRAGHSQRHQGLVTISRKPDESGPAWVARVATLARATITQAHQAYAAAPEWPGAELYFCITPVGV